MRIVYIEPDVVLARQYKKIFSQYPHVNVQLCLDPQAAVQVIDEFMPDVIALEPQLAPLSGFAFINELKSYEDLVDIPIVIYSSVPKESLRVDDNAWRTLGVHSYFYKAVDNAQKVMRYMAHMETS